jgi:ion channel-forming bestrophin family protein
MHNGNHYSFQEVILWTRRDIYWLLLISTIPTFLYIVLGWKWLAIPWLPVALLGTAVAFMVGFKNNASYDRVWEARKVWGAIVNGSRSWGMLVKDYVSNTHTAEPVTAEALRDIHAALYNRHFAWLTALRYQLREPRPWEAVYHTHNEEYRKKWFIVEEQETKLADAIRPYLSAEEYAAVMSKSNKAAQIIALQSAHLKELHEMRLIEDFRHMELEKLLVEFYNQQGASERIKNFPYPRQYATMNLWFTRIFIVLLPLGMLQEFAKFSGLSPWMAIPFSALSCWIFTTMEKIGESTESPFEGSANDVPITAMSRTIEIDLREMLGQAHDLKPLAAQNNILI